MKVVDLRKAPIRVPGEARFDPFLLEWWVACQMGVIDFEAENAAARDVLLVCCEERGFGEAFAGVS